MVINFDDYLDNTDAQQLQLEGTILRLESGGAVDLSVLIPENRVQKLSLEGTLLTLENGGSVDLAPLLVPSSNPKIDRFQLVSNTLEISLENDNVPPLQLSFNPLLKDEQKLSFTSSTLSLERGGNVDLSGFAIDLDEQKLAFSQLN